MAFGSEIDDAVERFAFESFGKMFFDEPLVTNIAVNKNVFFGPFEINMIFSTAGIGKRIEIQDIMTAGYRHTDKIRPDKSSTTGYE
jgi:hypothetical protein